MTGTNNRAKNRKPALSGLDRLISDDMMTRRLARQQVGLLTNHACTTADQVPATVAIKRSLDAQGGNSLRLFTPEHGMQLSAGAGEAVSNSKDPLTGLPVYSLYEGAENNAGSVLEGLDALIIDLRDVGVRCYTYAATAAKFATAALERHIEVIVCDRANPLGPMIEGPRPEPDRRSLLAYFDVPFVHGRTIGELIALAIAPVITQAPFSIYPADVSLQPPLGWIPPSPALSHPDAVAIYAGLVLLEATNVSEGRGTSVSFRSVAAPGLNAEALGRAVNEWNTGFGAARGEIFFTRSPASGQPVPGITLWPQRARRREPLALGVHLLAWLLENCEDFAWLPTAGSKPDMAIDVLFGRSDLRTQLEAGESVDAILRSWR
ncbi:MAG: DUF1343 domain-containing protein [Proteobacteria bacterium]|nr:DUF1343 domain-containing protein [Pseudomonadota bacterium]